MQQSAKKELRSTIWRWNNGKPLKWIKASDIKSDDEWMQEDVWDEIYKKEDNLPDINVGKIKESEE